MTYLHKNLAEGRWQKLSLSEQLANIGSEVGRAAKWQGKDDQNFNGALTRALELIDLTIDDPRWENRLFELGRIREIFCDGILGGQEYGTKLTDLEKYFMPFMNLTATKYSIL
ncbi:MAG: hypothetical protein A2817_01445 [Candidatus Yanofskybacteria bacterium RIFCSPHIGHO2_01_FULL_39_8b]|uniref:Uncharacterized protein n=1 Tax=Candidatus Yanofskybacteria bacterium RIFCSPHIGHO2_01_FULL_39_8b TaxID=1802659 RepID=A0A1F8E8F9_9BACT|nr:MAG: hypothetical protein A2817_01445 [Candidatus Yanofskybacteria bacterium RIFCSPHIGHO2_01_FULL_39_8b]